MQGTDIWEVGLFIATLALAVATFMLALRTSASVTQADEHHQQTLWPWLVLGQMHSMAYNHVSIDILNIGSGLATSAYAECTSIDGVSITNASTRFGPVAAGERRPVDIYFYGVNDQRRTTYNPGLPFTTVEVYLHFISIFGTHGYTRWVYRSESQSWEAGGTQPPEIKTRKAKFLGLW